MKIDMSHKFNFKTTHERNTPKNHFNVMITIISQISQPNSIVFLVDNDF